MTLRSVDAGGFPNILRSFPRYRPSPAWSDERAAINERKNRVSYKLHVKVRRSSVTHNNNISRFDLQIILL